MRWKRVLRFAGTCGDWSNRNGTEVGAELAVWRRNRPHHGEFFKDLSFADWMQQSYPWDMDGLPGLETVFKEEFRRQRHNVARFM